MNRLARWDNPIFRRELFRLERRKTGYRWRNTVIILGLVSILAMFLVLLFWMYPSGYGQQYIWMFFPAWAIWVIYAITVLGTILASIGVLSAEYADQTWEPLIITGISARRILLGNWLAALHRIRGWLFFLVIARIAVLPVYLIVSEKVARSECGFSGFDCVWQSPTIGRWSLAVGMTIALTILDVACCSLIGLAASAITRHSRFAAVLAILLRFSPLIIFLAFGFDDSNFWAWWASPPFALVDGGTAPAVQLIIPLLPNWVRFNPLLGLLLFTSALILIFFAVLSITFVALRLNSGSTHPLRQ
jgi:hypothetical protein